MGKKFRSVYDPGNAPIVGRFPVVAADIAADAVTAVKIQADAVTTAKIANDAVTQPKAATGVVDGDTITGAVIQTSVPGVGHPTLMLDGPNNAFNLYIGSSGETPGTITAGSASPLVRIQSGTVGASTTQSKVTLFSSTAGSSALTLESDQFNLSAAAGGPAAMILTGGLALSGSFTGAGNAHVGYRSTAANQTLVTATFAAMNLGGTADHNVGSGFSIASDVVTITNAGVYQLHAFCPFNTNTGNCRNLLRIETWTGSDPGVGAATIVAAAEDIGTVVQSNWMNCQAQRTFTAGAKVRVVLYQNQGTNATTQGATTPHQLNIRRVS